jgi:hypothetical protein
MKNEGALSKRFFRHDGIYRSDVSSLLLNLGQSTAFRSGPGQALGRAGRTRPAHRRDEFRPAIPQPVARQQCPSPLHRHSHLKTIARPNGIFYHRTVTFLLTVCLRHGDKLIAFLGEPYAVYFLALATQVDDEALEWLHNPNHNRKFFAARLRWCPNIQVEAILAFVS